MFKSIDSGVNWAAVNNGALPNNAIAQALAIDPVTTNTLYVGTIGGGVFKSTDGGNDWSAINTGLTNLAVQALAIDPNTPSTLYAGTNGGGVFESTDSGATWSAVNSLLDDTNVLALAIDPATSSRIYAGTSGEGLFLIVTTADPRDDNGGGGCFVATAAYGSPMGPHVEVLRDFRDRFLLDSDIGKRFLNLYYTYSPPMADYIANHDALRMVVRWSLLPVAGLSWMVLHLGPATTILSLFLLLTTSTIAIPVLFRRLRKKTTL